MHSEPANRHSENDPTETLLNLETMEAQATLNTVESLVDRSAPDSKTGSTENLYIQEDILCFCSTSSLGFIQPCKKKKELDSDNIDISLLREDTTNF